MREERFGTEQEETGGRAGGERSGRDEGGKERELGGQGREAGWLEEGEERGGGVNGREEGEVGRGGRKRGGRSGGDGHATEGLSTIVGCSSRNPMDTTVWLAA